MCYILEYIYIYTQAYNNKLSIAIVTKLIFSYQLMIKNQNFTPICGCMIAIHIYKHVLKRNLGL